MWQPSEKIAGSIWMVGVFLAAGLPSCGPADPAGRATVLGSTTKVEPTILAVTRRVAVLFARSNKQPLDSFLRYGAYTARFNDTCACYLLRLSAYEVAIQADTFASVSVKIEPPAGTHSTQSATRPVLPIRWSELVAAFGPPHGDRFFAKEEPVLPEPHGTTLSYAPSGAADTVRFSVWVRNPPSVMPNAVHRIWFSSAVGYLKVTR